MLALVFAMLAVAPSPEQKAVDYLVREVPRWSRENGCFSCHNNGDAARALFAAKARGYNVPDAALSDTLQWLSEPAKWDNTTLARVQFASAVAEGWRSGVIKDRTVLQAAVDTLLKERRVDGSWVVDTGGNPGAPATWGTSLATYMARWTLQTAGIKTAAPKLVPEVASVVEPFDLALAILAGRRELRSELIKLQKADGSWQETTRPPGLTSYAEHISTCGWATYALVVTNRERH